MGKKKKKGRVSDDETGETLRLEEEENTKVADVLQMLSTRMSWPEKHTLLRLEGFEEPWETCVLNGKECMEDSTLADCGITKDNCTVTTVRKILVAEGWKIKTGGLDDSDTDEDDLWLFKSLSFCLLRWQKRCV